MPIEDDDNLVLRLLREIRGKLDDHDRAFEGQSGRMTSIVRHIEDVKESVTYVGPRQRGL